MQQNCQIIEPLTEIDLGTRLSCFGSDKKQTFHPFHEEEVLVGKLLAKNIARTARKQLNRRHRLFAGLSTPDIFKY